MSSYLININYLFVCIHNYFLLLISVISQVFLPIPVFVVIFCKLSVGCFDISLSLYCSSFVQVINFLYKLV